MKRLVILAVGSLTLLACGPGAKIDGKQGAAEALLAASQPSKAGGDPNASPALAGVKWNCPEGGTADFTGAGINIGIGGGGTNVSTDFTLNFAGCGIAKSDVGVAIYNGKMTFSQNVAAGTGNVSVDQRFKGNIKVEGAFNDFLDADVTQRVAVGDLGASSGTGISMTLIGTIKTTEGTFTFDEMLTVMSGKITAKVEASK